MFWKKKDKGKDGKTPENGGKPTREQILAQAKANMSAARAEIGDETLDKIKDALMKKQASAIEQAKNQIKSANQDKVRDNIKFMMTDPEFKDGWQQLYLVKRYEDDRKKRQLLEAVGDSGGARKGRVM